MAKSAPLYRRIKERIRTDLVKDRAGSAVARLPAERELQARYGVSRPTISKALAELATEGVLVKAPGSGTFLLPQLRAPGAALQNGARRIGYVAPIPGHELTQRSLRGIERAAQRRDYRVIFGNAGSCVATEEAAVRELISAGVRGLVIGPLTRTVEEAPADYLGGQALGVPVVLTDTARPEHDYPKVIFDNWRAGYDMTRWLFETGHRRIGVLTFPERWLHATVGPRLQGIRDAHRDRGLALDPALVRRLPPRRVAEELHLVEDDLRAILDDWLELKEPPTAIIAPEDGCAMDVIDRLTLRGVDVPGQVQVIGFDNREIARRVHPGLPTTAPDFVRMGEIACELLLRKIESGESRAVTYVLEVPLLVDRAAAALTPDAAAATAAGAR